MTRKGIIRGKSIELTDPFPLPDGQCVIVSIESIDPTFPTGTAAAILRAMEAPPHLQPGDVDEMMRVIQESRLPVRFDGVFDGEDS